MKIKTIVKRIVNRQARKMSRDIEHGIQKACVTWFRAKFPDLRGLLFAVPNGGRRDLVTGIRLKEEGVVAGVSDLILFVRTRTSGALCIEMKTDTGKQSPAQKRWMKKVTENGYRYVVCRSVDEFMHEVVHYLVEAEIA